MGLCCSASQSTRNIDIESDLDKIIIISHTYMKNKLTQVKIEELLPKLLYTQLIEEKLDPLKTKNFFKWIDMSIKYKHITFSIDINNIINTFKRQKNEDTNNLLSSTNDETNKISVNTICFSFVENGLRNYYLKNKATFENSILNSPPGVFRWVSWQILCVLPESRNAHYFEKLVLEKISKKKNNEIAIEIDNTIESKCIISNKIKSCLFRTLKSLIITDQEIILFKGISYIIAYLLIITNFDELNIYYFMISLLSKTFSGKFGLRGFYIQEQPLLKVCDIIFQKNFDKYFPELAEHFIEINFPLSSWILFWIQMCYVNVFPNFLLLRVWDHFLVYGITFLLSLGLSIVEYLYEDLINNDIPENILELFKKLNPNLKSSYKKYEFIDYNIEDLITNAIKNYPISYDDINSELLNSFPNYNHNYIYQYKDNNLNKGETPNHNLITETEQNEIEENNNKENVTTNNLNIIKITDESYSILEENPIENIELSISQKKNFYHSENYYSETTSCEEIEDENIYVNEHIQDLISKQSFLNKNCKFNLKK